jgi:hypothetical protein
VITYMRNLDGPKRFKLAVPFYGTDL